MALSARARHWIFAAVKWAFIVAVLAFGVVYVASRWDQVSPALGRMSALQIISAFGLVLVALFFAMLSWIVLWPAFRARLPLTRGARVFYVSQLGKYLPGSVWPIAAQAQMAKDVGLSRASSVVLSLISMLVSIAVGLAIGLILVPFIDPSLLAQYWWLAAIGLALVSCLIPPILTFGVHLVLRVLRRPEAPFHFTSSISVRSASAQAANWVAGGLHLWIIVVALGASPGATLLPCLAAFPLAFVVGILLVPVPAGLGVREFVMTLVLGAVTTSAIALTAALVSRILFALGDFSAAGIAVLVDRVAEGRQRDAEASSASASKSST